MSAQSATQDMGGNFLRLGYDFYEEVMPNVSGNAFKVALVIYRETIGRKRQKDGWQQTAISYTDLEKKTGLSRSTLERVIKELLKKGIIQVCNAVGRWGMRVYVLAQRFICGEDTSMVKTTIVQSPLLGSMVKMNTVVWSEQPQFYGQNEHSSMVEMTIEPIARPALEEAADEPKETLKERERKNKESVGSVPSEIYEQIEDQKENVQNAETILAQALDTLEHTPPLSKEHPEASREARRAEHEVTRQKERLAIFECCLELLEQGLPPRQAMDKAKSLVLGAVPARSSA